MSFTFDDMQRFATEAWGSLGGNTALKWRDFNRRYFADELRPVPVVLTHTQPFGRRLAFCSHSHEGRGRTITLNVPAHHLVLVADNATLLHEMVHQLLFERGEDPAHDSEGWRREIMRLNKLLTGKEIWAGRSTTMRQDGKVVRRNRSCPETGQISLTQMQIARWPHGWHDLGELGT
jgi:hypothetical protein